MKILITGATGFIGNYIINQLLRTEHLVIASSVEYPEDLSNISWINKVNYIQCDLNQNIDNYFTFFKKPDILIHLAWEGLPNYKELFHIEKNLYTNYKFIKNMIVNGLKNITAIGTCFEYGMQNGCLSEITNTHPDNPYGIAKDTLRKFIEQLNKEFIFEYNWVRLFYIYGKGQGQKSLYTQLVNAVEKKITEFNMSGGEQLRDFLPIEKVASNIIKIALGNKSYGVINCCSGNPISVRKFVENYFNRHNSKIKLNLGYYPYPSYEPFAFWGDNSKLKSILNEKMSSL